MTKLEQVALTKDLAQIAFWIVSGAIVVLTYRQARRTVLQPIRTEVFKEQLKLTSETMSLFVGKHELALRADFDFQTLFDVNVWHLLDDYADRLFDVKVDFETRPYNSRDCPLRTGARDPRSEASTKQAAGIASPAAIDSREFRLASWALYETEILYINRQFCEMNQKVWQLLENPLLPLPLVKLLTQYTATAGKNQSVLRRLLDIAAKQLPERFPTLEDLEHMDQLGWPRELWNLYMREFHQLKPVADEIVKFVREYFEADNLKRH